MGKNIIEWVFEFEDGLVIIKNKPDWYDHEEYERDYIILRNRNLNVQGKLKKVTIR